MVQTTFGIAGKDAALASQKEIAAGIKAAVEVFARNQADPLACAAANAKRERDEALTPEEALLCVIWDEADDAAWRAVTRGWLSRDVDIQLAPAAH